MYKFPHKNFELQINWYIKNATAFLVWDRNFNRGDAIQKHHKIRSVKTYKILTYAKMDLYLLE